ncbi:MAG: TolC family protein [Bacteroidota bacterium]
MQTITPWKLLVGFLFFFQALAAQNTGQPVLDAYIQEAFAQNIALQRQTLSYEKALYALREAKAAYFPQLSINARYSVAAGGRAIEIPVGDLVNPVYQNLNLINAIGQATDPTYPAIEEYPTIENVDEFFLRAQEHETKVSLVQPVFNQLILKNQQIKKDLVSAEQIGVDLYKRTLVQEVKTAYYQYLLTLEVVKLFDQTKQLGAENLRTSQSLFDNHQVTIDAVYAAEAQLKEIEQQLLGAGNDRDVAQAYFNFLLNAPLERAIQEIEQAEIPYITTLTESTQMALSQREELRQLGVYLSAADHKVGLDQSAYYPNLAIAAEYGFQGVTYSFGEEDDYFLGSVVLTVPLFQGTTAPKVQQSRIEKEQLVQQLEETRSQLSLQVLQTYRKVQTAYKAIEVAKAQVESAEKAYTVVAKKYKQGQTNLITLTDAQTRVTNARQQAIINRYQYLIQLAEIERVTASYPIN